MAYFESGPSTGYLREVVVDPGGLDLKTAYTTDARGNVTSVNNPRGVLHQVERNDLDWVVTEIRAATGASRDPASNAGPLGYTYRYVYDRNGNLAEEEVPFGTSASVTVNRFTYGMLDEMLEESREIEPGGVGGAIATTVYERDPNLNVTRVTDPEGNVVETDYDPRNLAVTMRRGLGAQALAETIVETASFNADRERASFTNGLTRSWTTQYDGYGRVKEAVDPLGNRTTTEYTNDGLVAETKRFDTAGELLARSGAEYDALDRTIRTKRWLWDSDPADAVEVTEQLEYDDASNLTMATDALGRKTEYEYDTAERRVAVIDPLQNRIDLALDQAGNVTHVTTTELVPGGGSVTVTEETKYDALDRPVTQIDGLGNETAIAYDARSLRRRVTDPRLFTTSFEYDGLNRLTKKTRPEDIVERFVWDKSSRLSEYRDARDHTTSYAYDAANRRVSTTLPDNKIHMVKYDAADNATELTDPNGSVTVQAYDTANRLTGRTVTRASNVEGPSAETYTYDGLYRLTQAISGGVAATMSYDSFSREVEDRHHGRAVTYGHDLVDNPRRLGYPTGLSVDQAFDGLDRLSGVSTVTVQGEEEVLAPQAAFGYRGPWLRHDVTLPNGLAGARSYDGARRELQNLVVRSDGASIFDERLSWSQRGLKSAVTRGDRGGMGLTLGHDGAGRLLAAVRGVDPAGTLGNNTEPDPTALLSAPTGDSYAYDSTDNLLSRVTVEDRALLDNALLPADGSGRNRPGKIEQDAEDPADDLPLTYDANGNLISAPPFTYRYDFRNRLTRVLKDGLEIASFKYDAFNRLVEKTIGTDTTEYVYAGWQEIEEYRNGVLHLRHLRGQGLDEIVRMEVDFDLDGTIDSELVPIYDHTGNLVTLTDSQGRIVARYDYRPFGEDTIPLVDDAPPEVQQIRLLLDGPLPRFVVEGSEEVREPTLEGSFNVEVSGSSLTAGGQATTKVAAITAVSQPVQEGPVARRSLEIELTEAPEPGTEVTLTIEPQGLRDLFLNEPAEPFGLTFFWPEPSEVVVLLDTTAPEVERLLLTEDGHLEIHFNEPPDLPAASAAILVDGATTTWTLLEDGYGMRTEAPLPGGLHSFEIPAGAPIDLAGRGLDVPFVQSFEKSLLKADVPASMVFQRADSRRVPVETLVNRFGFHGRPVDLSTGLVYFRNRWYAPRLGRFLSPDPMGHVDGPSQYQFAGYSPFNFGDPMGLCVGGLQRTRFCQGIANFLSYQLWGDPLEIGTYEGEIDRRIAAFSRSRGRLPSAGEVVYSDPTNAQVLRDGAWVDMSGRIDAAHDELFFLGAGVGARTAVRISQAAGGGLAGQTGALVTSVADDVAGEILGVNPSLARGLVRGPLKNRSGDLDAAAHAARTQPHHPMPEVRRRRSLGQRLADKARNLTSAQRPNTVAVLKSKDGRIVVGRNQGGVTNPQVESALDTIPPNQFGGVCAEPNCIARALNKGIDVRGATIEVVNVRGPASKTGIHGTPKPACSVCSELLNFFGIGQ